MAHVLDTSALVPLFLDQPGADQVEAVLQGADEVLVPFMALMELRYVLARRLPHDRVNDIIETLRATGVTVPESDPAWGAAAAGVKAGGGLSLADAWNASLALLHDADLWHRDPEFDRVDGLRAHRLP